MSRHGKANRRALDENPLGKLLRELRHARGLPLRLVAPVADMDTTLLSKVELGQRLPTEKQIAALAAFFGIPPQEMEAKRIEERFWMEHKDNPAAHKAAALIGKKKAGRLQPEERDST